MRAQRGGGGREAERGEVDARGIERDFDVVRHDERADHARSQRPQQFPDDGALAGPVGACEHAQATDRTAHFRRLDVPGVTLRVGGTLPASALTMRPLASRPT